MVMREQLKIDGRETRITNTNLPDWWILQQHFAYPPFNEFFNTDKLIVYYDEFIDGGVYQLEINIKDNIWLPAALISWHPMVENEHPVEFDSSEKVAYISDSVTVRGYRKKGIQTQLFNFTFEEMKKQNYTHVYLRTSPMSHMCQAALKFGFKQIEGAFQVVKTMRVSGEEEEEVRIFFEKKL